MMIFPAIDIIEGHCVRLTQGDYARKITYGYDPVAMALKFKNQGAAFLHVVDLDGAKKGLPVNTKKILDIQKATGLIVQVGGGIRQKDSVDLLLENGISRVVFGTASLQNKQLLQYTVDRYGNERVAVSLDMIHKKMATNGWLETKNVNLPGFLKDLQQIGIKYLIVTNIEKDGMLDGIDATHLDPFFHYNFEVVSAGGVSSIKDLEVLEKRGVYGAIVGKAIYEKRVSLTSLVTKFSQSHLSRRIIPCMDIKNGDVVKGTHFQQLEFAGDAVELGEFYSNAGADELVFLDITATVERRQTLTSLVKKVAKRINIPFSVGGGIQSIEDIRRLLGEGADKVSIGSKAVTSPQFIEEASTLFGNQCIVISVDAKLANNREGWDIYIKGGREKTKLDAMMFVETMQRMGAGELLINSLDKDGTKQGFDISLLQEIGKRVTIPIIASSGAGDINHFIDVFKKTKVTAALAARIFHYKEIKIASLKKQLALHDVPVRI